EENSLGTHPVCQLYVARVIADQIGTSEIQLQLRYSPFHHPDIRFATAAAIVRMVRAEIDRIQRRILLFQKTLQAGMDRFKILEGHNSTANTGLVSHDH